MKKIGNMLFYVSIFINVVLIFFGSYIGNLYIIQSIALGLAILTGKILNMKIMFDTKMWLAVCTISIISPIFSIDKESSIEIAALILMAVLLKIIYENNVNNKWQKFFLDLVFICSGIHVFATIFQLIMPSFIEGINTILLNSEGLQINLEFYKLGAYAGITAQTSVNAFYIAIFVGITFFKTLFCKEKKINIIYIIFIILGLIALFITGKRGILITTLISLIITMFYVSYIDKKNIFKYFLIFSIIGTLGYFVMINIPAVKVIFDKIEVLNKEENVLNGRDELWKKSIDIFNENPFIGIGLGSVKNVIGDYSHNIYIQLLAEVGIIGTILYIIAIICSFCVTMKKVRIILKLKDSNDKITILISLFLQFIFIIYGFSGNPLFGQFFLLPYIISIAIANSIKIEKGEEKYESRNNYLS